MKNPVPRSFVLPALFAALIAIALVVSRPDSTPSKQEVASALQSPPPTASTQAPPAPVPEAAPATPAAALPLFRPPGPASGQRVVPGAPDYRRVSASATKPSGRAAVVERAGFSSLKSLHAGDSVQIPLMDGKSVEGRVNLVQTDAGALRIAGELSNGNGSFSLSSKGATISGMILLKREKLAYELEEQKDGKLWMLEKLRAEVVCDPLPPEPGAVPRPAKARSRRCRSSIAGPARRT